MKQILWAPTEFIKELEQELEIKKVKTLEQKENLFFVESEITDFVWSESSGLHAEKIQFNSIKQAQTILKEKGKLWTPFPLSHFRKSELIATELLVPKARKRSFKRALPKGDLGCYLVVNENEMWVTPHLTPGLPPGPWDFEEDKEAPSRAYLKIYEWMARTQLVPLKNSRCLELGSAPGGWTWVLANLGCQVTAVDKGDMDPKVLAKPHVKWLRKDAFLLNPEDVGPVDWLFSDLICYPARLLELVELWRRSGVKNFVCTIKFQGKTDFQALENFLRLPGSKALHLSHNKHEVTWWMCS